jgi:hypothetical protein
MRALDPCFGGFDSRFFFFELFAKLYKLGQLGIHALAPF